jgi:hypothetical protein
VHTAFEDERQRAPAHVTFDNLKGVDVHLDFFALINRVKMRRGMVAIKHSNDNSVEAAQFRHDGRLIGFKRLTSLAANKTRDRVVNRTLRRAEWGVVWIWEHELQSGKHRTSNIE